MRLWFTMPTLVFLVIVLEKDLIVRLFCCNRKVKNKLKVNL